MDVEECVFCLICFEFWVKFGCGKDKFWSVDVDSLFNFYNLVVISGKCFFLMIFVLEFVVVNDVGIDWIV